MKTRKDLISLDLEYSDQEIIIFNKLSSLINNSRLASTHLENSEGSLILALLVFKDFLPSRTFDCLFSFTL